MDPLKKGIAIGMLFGSGKEAELNDKEVEIDVGDILDALTGIFTYNPEDEDPQGDPPGPWDGYSLFTIDLTAVKQSLEDIIAALQQHDPDYDPDETSPEDAVEDLVEENEQQEQTIEDLTEQVEECDQCKADVIAKLQEYDPQFDPQTCEDIPPEIDKLPGYTPPVGTPIEDILKIAGADDTVEIEGNTYHFDYYVLERNTDVHYPLYTKFEGTSQQVYAVAPKMDVYDNTNTFVTSMFIAGTQSQGVPVGYKYQITSTVIDYANKLFIVSYEVIDNWGNVITGTENNDISAYLDTTSPNPTYKIKNG